MKNNLRTLTIGIPAYNEEKNIENLLKSIQSQIYSTVSLNHIIVICDGCTDRTVEIVKKIGYKDSRIKIIESKVRSGKAEALNKLYKESNTDYLMTIDADVIFKGRSDIEIMAKVMSGNPKLKMVGPSHHPTKSHTLFGNFSRLSALIFFDAVYEFNKGNNFYSCMSVEFMRKSFYKSFLFPTKTVADQCYAYGQAIKNSTDGYQLVKNSGVIFGVAQTFYDWRVLSVRSTLGDKNDTIKHYGDSILPLYTMPRKILIRSTLKWLLKSPVYSIGAVIMNLYIRLFPYNHKVKNGIWEMVDSSKELYL